MNFVHKASEHGGMMHPKESANVLHDPDWDYPEPTASFMRSHTVVPSRKEPPSRGPSMRRTGSRKSNNNSATRGSRASAVASGIDAARTPIAEPGAAARAGVYVCVCVCVSVVHGWLAPWAELTQPTWCRVHEEFGRWPRSAWGVCTGRGSPSSIDPPPSG